MEENIQTEKNPLRRRRTDIPSSSRFVNYLRQDISKKTAFLGLGIYALLSIFYYGVIKPPVLFPSRSIIRLEEGMSLKEVSDHLKDLNVVRSPLWLRNFVIFYSGEKSTIAGDYFFEEPVSLFTVASRITDKNYRMSPLRITIPEGYNTREIAEVYSKTLVGFEKDFFLEEAKTQEGYLFPDTYFFLPTASASTVLSSMRDNFKAKTDIYIEEIEKSGRSMEEIIKMASILELEGNDEDSRRTISGILWKRLDLGMALQVDASFAYLLNKGTSEISMADLQLDSPYNTYKYKGLPPTPISNPGLESILAALRPKETSFLYYLSDKKGRTYYATDFEGHKKNRRLYME